jgi:hypothetical protein
VTGNWFDTNNWSAGVPGSNPGVGDQGFFIPSSGNAIINGGFALVATPPGNYFALEGGLEILNGGNLTVSDIHVQNVGNILMQDGSFLNISDEINLGEWGSGSLSLLSRSSMDVNVLFNQQLNSILSLDLTGWLQADLPIITAGATSLNGTLNLLSLDSLDQGGTITLISSGTPDGDGKRWTTVEVDGMAQQLTEVAEGLYDFDYNNVQYALNYADGVNGGDVTIGIAPAPEPSVWAIDFLGGFTVLVAMAKRRGKRP